MNDQEIRMWAFQALLSHYSDFEAALKASQRLYLFITGKIDDLPEQI